MSSRLSLFSATLLLLLPAPLLAGGPPRLCLPIDGVTAQSAQACGNLLTTKLKDKLWRYEQQHPEVRVRQQRDQWYLTFAMGKDVGLSDVEAALKGSAYSIPRDKLRLFGHVILEIDAAAPPEKLRADLEALALVSIAESPANETEHVITVEMPYPVADRGGAGDEVGWDAFSPNDLSSVRAPRSEPPAKASELPSYKTLRDLVARHGVGLKDIRWSTEFACRALGGVAVKESSAVAATKSAADNN